MQKNLSISNFRGRPLSGRSLRRRSKSYLIFLIAGFYGTFCISVLLFHFKPHCFYWRPWEYVEEIVYNTPGCALTWKGYEKGDMSRRFLGLFQDQGLTTVSCDPHGFRSVPYQSDRYPILIVGDSHVWGSGLSDHETLAWQLAERMHIPVYNGGKGYKMLEKLLSRDELKDTDLIIELVQSVMLSKANFSTAFNSPIQILPYQSISDLRKHKFADLFTPKRYFIASKALRICSPEILLRTAKTLLKSLLGISNIFDSKKTTDDLEFVVSEIAARSRKIQDLGHNYLFIPIPMQQAVMYDQITPSSVHWETELIRKLREKGVHAIDLTTPFLEHRKEELYFPTDSHWNARGVALAVSKIISYSEVNNFHFTER